ncbi:MAG: xanthine dehydrogenase family protein molybdopterin-binding subunit [Alphaproteobacteria bacterium]|nr:xanthine dehydrogenase family protein molybdopterin-binding subunit [Alphaproteobacteria bacterium]
MSDITHQKFGVGQSVSRKEDPRLIEGRGRYTDDIELPDQTYAAFLRSPVAHGLIDSLDVAPARSAPGVLAIVTADDLNRAGYGEIRCTLPLKNADGSSLFAPPRPLMAKSKVRHVGEILAMVVAHSEAAARDATERIEVEITPLPAVVDSEAALADDAPEVHPGHGNRCLDWRYGDQEAVDRAFAEAAHVTRIRLENNRVVVAAMEPRAALAAFDADAHRYTLHVGCQGAFGLRQGVAGLLRVEPHQLRVLTGDVGGSFGMKSAPYPEYVALLHAAKALGRPVKWRDSRSESFVSDQQGRATVSEGALALDDAGRFLAVRVHHVADMGAYLTAFGPSMPSANMQRNLPSLYTTGAMAIRTQCAFTNTVPIGPYRGAGRPEANYIMERLVDQAARETGRDPATLRRQNLIPAHALPRTALSGLTYDSGDFETVLDKGLRLADWSGFEQRRRASEAAGRIRGRGLACYLEVTAPPRDEMAAIRFEADFRSEADFRVTLITGTLDYGQGHASAFAQVVADRLGLPFEKIDLVQGDSDQLLAGGGTGGSRSIMASGKALIEASAEVIEQGKALAAHQLEAAKDDIAFLKSEAGQGVFRIRGTDRQISLFDLACATADPAKRPDGHEAGLNVALIAEGPPSAFPNGCHIAEVEIDPETGAVSLESYVAMDDFGTLINPMLAEGQVHGGVVQGIGQATMERAVYDHAGQLISGSFMDYALPRAGDLPAIDVGFHPVPATSNPLGAKGCGEAGVTGALPAVMNAISDALARRGAGPIDMPATPERVWRALDAARVI